MQQAIRAGCDVTCAKQMRLAFAELSAVREATRGGYVAGRIDSKTIYKRAVEAQHALDRRLAGILGPQQLAALDKNEAHHKAVIDIERCKHILGENAAPK